jgi:hypothetical protein
MPDKTNQGSEQREGDRRVSLHPLSLTEAVRGLLEVEPEGRTGKRPARKRQKIESGGGESNPR